jgi:hypothetical protein
MFVYMYPLHRFCFYIQVHRVSLAFRIVWNFMCTSRNVSTWMVRHCLNNAQHTHNRQVTIWLHAFQNRSRQDEAVRFDNDDRSNLYKNSDLASTRIETARPTCDSEHIPACTRHASECIWCMSYFFQSCDFSAPDPRSFRVRIC